MPKRLLSRLAVPLNVFCSLPSTHRNRVWLRRRVSCLPLAAWRWAVAFCALMALLPAPPAAGQADLLVDSVYSSTTPTGISNFKGSPYTVTGNETYDYAYVGYQNSGTLTQTGGILTVSGVLLVGFNQSSNGVYNFDGGTLVTNGVMSNAGVGTFHFNGGTLRAASDTGSFLFGSRLTADVRNGGGSIDTAGHSVTISQNLLHSSVSGDNAADGGLTKIGAGTLTLSGANTYTGNTTVSAGTLNLANTLALQNSTLALTGGAVTFASSVTANAFTLGGLSGSGNLALANNASTPAAINLSVGGNNASTTYTGNLSGAGSLTKLGTGTLTLTGPNTYTGATSVNAGTLAITGGSVGVASAPTVLTVSGPGTGKAAATLNLSGGTLSASAAAIGTLVYGQAGQTGVFNQTGGTFTTNGGTLNVGIGISSDGNSTSFNAGTYTLSAGNLNTGPANIGNEGGSGTFIQTGGDFTTNGNQFALSNASNSASNNASGTYTLGGGTLTTGTALFGRSFFGFSGSSTFNLNGGTFTPTQIISGGGTSTFHFNGGTLRAGASDSPGAASNPTTFFSGLTTADVQQGGAKIDTNGFNVTVAQKLLHDTTNNAPTRDGGLTKLGSGTLTLAGANTYTGLTTVTTGMLAAAVNGALGQGDVNVQANATLTLSTGVTAAHNNAPGTTLSLALTSVIDLEAATRGTVQDQIGGLVIGGVTQTLAGTYGSLASGATFVFPEFTGNGVILFSPVPEPGTWALVGLGAISWSLLTLRRRRRTTCLA